MRGFRFLVLLSCMLVVFSVFQVASTPPPVRFLFGKPSAFCMSPVRVVVDSGSVSLKPFLALAFKAWGLQEGSGFVFEEPKSLRVSDGIFKHDDILDGQVGVLFVSPDVDATDFHRVPSLAGSVLANGSSLSVGGRVSKGSVLVDAEQWRNLSTGSRVSVLAHELGHVFGFAHSFDPMDLMYGSVPAYQYPSARETDGFALVRSFCG